MEEVREEMNIEGTNRETMKAENRVWLMDVEFCNGEKITVSGNDISIIERFEAAGEELETLADDMEKRETEEKTAKEKIAERREFSEKAAEIMDGVFGEGTTRKYFGDVYEAIPDFCPDVECFMDFWDSLIPVIERLSDHKVKLEKLASKARIDKYKPRDYKKPSAKK